MTHLPDGKLYIDGKLRDAAGGAKYEDISPWTGEVIAYAADGTAQDMNEAIAAARRAFDTTDWATNSDLRVAKVRKLDPEQLRLLVGRQVQHPILGLIGETSVNVLQLNLALDSMR